jgi:DNA replication licensing factor MCM3
VDLSPLKNVSLPDSILSRFDLVFILLDKKNSTKDRLIAKQVLKNHMYRGTEDNNNTNKNYNTIVEPDHLNN